MPKGSDGLKFTSNPRTKRGSRPNSHSKRDKHPRSTSKTKAQAKPHKPKSRTKPSHSPETDSLAPPLLQQAADQTTAMPTRLAALQSLSGLFSDLKLSPAAYSATGRQLIPLLKDPNTTFLRHAVSCVQDYLYNCARSKADTHAFSLILALEPLCTMIRGKVGDHWAGVGPVPGSEETQHSLLLKVHRTALLCSETLCHADRNISDHWMFYLGRGPVARSILKPCPPEILRQAAKAVSAFAWRAGTMLQHACYGSSLTFTPRAAQIGISACELVHRLAGMLVSCVTHAVHSLNCKVKIQAFSALAQVPVGCPLASFEAVLQALDRPAPPSALPVLAESHYQDSLARVSGKANRALIAVAMHHRDNAVYRQVVGAHGSFLLSYFAKGISLMRTAKVVRTKKLVAATAATASSMRDGDVSFIEDLKARVARAERTLFTMERVMAILNEMKEEHRQLQTASATEGDIAEHTQ
eukprot:gnl/Dysnectes_brevis/2660_a3217_655.p1 GENE.gnl/Dysnectes_brevis/2660_a3217_655~~gnl/Dysnectes_brevis/2660_a3217_655.p1  ORF type:complete len:501 (+),score=150.79 gnl/Dysnectes_brevis/2660_a3217_655:97-1503(+)